MSRSFRKHPVVKDGKRHSKKHDRAIASRKRRAMTRAYISRFLRNDVFTLGYSKVQSFLDTEEANLLPGDLGHFKRWHQQYLIWEYRSYYPLLEAFEFRYGWGVKFYRTMRISWREIPEEKKKEIENKWRKVFYWK